MIVSSDCWSNFSQFRFNRESREGVFILLFFRDEKSRCTWKSV
jgi:hypothetical protein